MLADQVAEAVRRWSLSLDPPFPDLSYNWVAPVSLPGGTRAVLKIGPPHRELASEIDALRRYGGDGAVRLLDADAELGLMLLERLLPGERLVSLPDDDATLIFAELASHLARPGDGFRTLEDWTDALVRTDRTSLVDRAQQLRRDLLDSSEDVLLHGDLHHYNILSAQRQRWLAIDPKGLCGDRSYEPAPFLMNPIARVLADPTLIPRRLALLSQRMQLDPKRVRAWAFVHAVLSSCWSREDGEDPGPAMELAAQLSASHSQSNPG